MNQRRSIEIKANNMEVIQSRIFSAHVSPKESDKKPID